MTLKYVFCTDLKPDVHYVIIDIQHSTVTVLMYNCDNRSSCVMAL